MNTGKNKRRKRSSEAVVAGAPISTARNAAQYADNAVLGARQGHGFAAERANHFVDKHLLGRDAVLVGQDNARNGIDRLVNGSPMQSKYCETGARCITSCFEKGAFRYFGSDGTPMQIEVPFDKYEDAVKEMARRIANGGVPGVSDPAKARDMVRRGHFTYRQARNMAKFCTRASLIYDAANGAVVAVGTVGITALMALARAAWSGDIVGSALVKVRKAVLQAGGISLASTVLAQQLGRTGCDGALRGMTDALVKKMSSSTNVLIVNSIRSGKEIHGAAARNYLSKLLRGNVVSGAATVAVLSSVDVYRMIDGRISSGQLFKNVATTTAGVAGGTAGYIAAVAAAVLLGPLGSPAVIIIGSAGGLIGGALGSSAARTVLDEFIEDDALKMFRIFKKALAEQAMNFRLNKAELDLVMRKVNALDLGDEMLNMYRSRNRKSYANSIVKSIIHDVVSMRNPVRNAVRHSLFIIRRIVRKA